MGDLYSDDIEDQAEYPDEEILKDVRALINTGQREGPILDYKKDVSDKDNWAEAAAAFANTFGGLIIFGVEGKLDQPRRLTGFDFKNVEMKTKLMSTLLSRIQPRPAFQIRVVTHDMDRTKEVAILRIPEGSHPPYMHSKGDHHCVYIRVGAQKAEADYLQLSALFEKRLKVESQAESFLSDLAGPASSLYVIEPGTNVTSLHWYRLVIAPEDRRAAKRLTVDVERQFQQCIHRVYGLPQADIDIRTSSTTYFLRGMGTGKEQRLALTANGSLGFTTHACIRTNDGPFFIPIDFCHNLLDFLILAATWYEKSRYYGGSVLNVRFGLQKEAQLYAGLPRPDAHLQGSDIFEPPLESIPAINSTVQTPCFRTFAGVGKKGGGIEEDTGQVIVASRIVNCAPVQAPQRSTGLLFPRRYSSFLHGSE